MSKPSWDDAPEWARFLTVDQDGEWFWREFDPEHSSFGPWWESEGRKELAVIEPKWYEFLESRP